MVRRAAVVLAFVVFAAPARADVTLVAGTGADGHDGDGGPATMAELRHPSGLAELPSGTVVIADEGDTVQDDGRIRLVSPGGTISTRLAEGGAVGSAFAPVAVAAYGGAVAVADGVRDALYLVNDSSVARIAGGDADDHDPEEADTEPSGEGGLCDASLDVVDVAFAGMVGSGLTDKPSFLLVDAFTNQDPAPDGRPARVLRLVPVEATTGCSFYGVQRAAGGGPEPPGPSAIAPSGDGLAATDVYLNEITAVASLHRHGGGFLVATAGDSDGPTDCRIRRVSAGGAVTTIAGIGVCAAGGDGGQADETAIDRPSDVEVAPDGSVLFVEGEPAGGPFDMARVRRIATDGTISTVEATNPFGGVTFGPAHYPFPQARTLATNDDGDLLVGSRGASGGGRVVRLAAPPAPLPPPPTTTPDPPPTTTTTVPISAPGPTPIAPAPKILPPRKRTTTLARATFTVRRGRRLTLRFTTTAAGRYELTLTRAGKRRLRRTGAARAGTTVVRVPITVRPGRYRLKLRVGTASDTATLVVSRAARARAR